MFTDPVKNLRALGLTENMIVADLGAGSGFYTLPAARIATNGRVYAVEVVKESLHLLAAKAKSAHLKNVEVVWGNVDKPGGTKLRDGLADAVIASNILFQVEDRDGFVAEVKRILKKGGEVLLIDWSDASELLGQGHAPVPKAVAREMFEAKGFAFAREVDAGAHHYGMILSKL